MERRVHRHRQVARDQHPAQAARGVRVLRRADEDPGRQLDVRADDRRGRGHVRRRQPVRDRAVGLARGQPQHARAQRRQHDRRRRDRRALQPELRHRERVVLLADLLPRQRRAQEPQRVPGPRERLLEGSRVPASRRSPATTRRCRARTGPAPARRPSPPASPAGRARACTPARSPCPAAAAAPTATPAPTA